MDNSIESNYNYVNRLYIKKVKFDEPYPYKPIISIWVKRIKGNSPTPHFLIPNDEITREGFVLHYERRKKSDFKYYYDVILEEKKVVSVKKEI